MSAPSPQEARRPNPPPARPMVQGASPLGAQDALAPGDESLEGGGRKRRRRRRRRRGGGADGAFDAQGMQQGQADTPEGIAAPPPRALAPATAPRQAPADFPADSDDGFEGGGSRRRKRRRRRRRGSEAGEAQPSAAPQPAARRPPPPPSRPPQRSQEAFDGGFGGGGSRREKRRRGGRSFDGSLPWDSQREAPAVNVLPERDPFTELTSVDPDERIDLETDTEEMSMRVVDLVTPIGKGQRALIVAPPKTGKTTLLMQLARAISENHPEIELVVMLVDERPEEVTAFRRAGYGEVLASSNDEPTHRHLKLTQHVLDIAKRRVLEGKDVCVLLDSITRMARAHNIASSGHKTMSGGLDTRALERPKRFFGAARKIHGGGSLTILATALIDTGSRMDEVIFQEFKGTGNSELQLDRRLAERRIWPAIDIQRSGTRKEEKLFERAEYEGIVALRRALSGKPPAEAMQLLLARLGQYKTNREFLLDVARKAASAL